jgi:hypothetical protein
MPAALYLAKNRQLDIIDDTPLAMAKNSGHSSTVAPLKNGSYLSTVVVAESGGHSSTVAMAENGGHSSTDGLKRLDARRRKAKISVQDLCADAGIHANTYRFGLEGHAATSPRVMTKLKRSLDRLAAGAEPDMQRTLCMALVRFLTWHVSRLVGVDPTQVLACDFSHERPTDRVWLQAARIRRCAVYLLVEGPSLRVGAATVAAAIGQKRQAVHKAVAAIETERERDPEFDALMRSLMLQLTGEAR